MRRNPPFLIPTVPLLSCVWLIFLFAACGDDSTTTPGSTTPDATIDGAKDANTETSTDTGADTGPIPVRCTDTEFSANDMTDGGSLEVTFPTGSEPAQYTNRCATVKLGASVTFSGAFSQHPLEPSGGDTPNPIPSTEATPAGGKLTVTFTKAGTFGFQCGFHPTIMFGGIKVVP